MPPFKHLSEEHVFNWADRDSCWLPTRIDPSVGGGTTVVDSTWIHWPIGTSNIIKKIYERRHHNITIVVVINNLNGRKCQRVAKFTLRFVYNT